MGDTSFTVVKSSNILDYAKTLPFGWHFFRGASETPGNPTATASAMVIAYVITASRDISLLAYVHGNKAFLNTCSSGTWSGWQELATKSDLETAPFYNQNPATEHYNGDLNNASNGISLIYNGDNLSNLPSSETKYGILFGIQISGYRAQILFLTDYTLHYRCRFGGIDWGIWHKISTS